VNDTTWSTLVGIWRSGRLELYVDGFSRASSTVSGSGSFLTQASRVCGLPSQAQQPAAQRPISSRQPIRLFRLLGPRGLILVEIKSRPGTVEGDGHSWIWTTEGRKRTEDNPILLANRKAKSFASLIRRQDALAKGKMRPPFVIEAVFLSEVRPPLKLDARLRERVFLRGRPGHEEDDGIVRALTGGLENAFPD
jgi:Nuclease-related domain